MIKNYQKLGSIIAINTVIMFALTYALIAEFGHFYPNINRFYMAVMMAAPMVVMMLVFMRSMYPNKRLNMALISVFALVFIITLGLARTQTPVGDEQFLRSMIPHHSSAILMCEQGQVTDPEISELCVNIVEAQKSEIAQMKEILKRY